MNRIEPLFAAPFHVVSDHGDCVWVTTLTRETARRHAGALVEIHGLIPFVRWTPEDFLSGQIGRRVFHHKWELSLIITVGPQEPVGFLLSYLRPPDTNFPSMSVYMHRMAIVARLQRRGIGRQIIAEYLHRVFDKVPVDYVSLQTNDTPENTRIIALYESLGFEKVKHVVYPDKTDWLMACRRS